MFNNVFFTNLVLILDSKRLVPHYNYDKKDVKLVSNHKNLTLNLQFYHYTKYLHNMNLITNHQWIKFHPKFPTYVWIPQFRIKLIPLF
jgi:hypothetical protein